MNKEEIKKALEINQWANNEEESQEEFYKHIIIDMIELVENIGMGDIGTNINFINRRIILKELTKIIKGE